MSSTDMQFPLASEPSSALAVATAAVGGNFQEMAQVTHPLMRDYARKCSADFIVFDKPIIGELTFLPGRYEKWQVSLLLERYQRVLFIDNDVLVSPLAPNIFDLVPTGTFGMVNEEAFDRVGLDRQLTQEVLGPVTWTVPYFNSGVMVIDQAHRELFDPHEPLLHRWDAYSKADSRYHPAGEDQAYLNYVVNLRGVPAVDLGHHWNFTRVRTDGHLRFRSNFIHYAGPDGFRYGARLDQIRADGRVFGSRTAFAYSRAFPALRWLADRWSLDFVRYRLGRLRRQN